MAEKVCWGAMLVGTGIYWEAALVGGTLGSHPLWSGKAIFQGGAVPLAVYKGGMLESFPEGGSALVDFAKKFWMKLPKGMSHARDLTRKTPMRWCC